MLDGLDTMYTLLQVPDTGSWTIANTGNRTPVVVKTHTRKYISANEGDKVRLYYTSGNQPSYPDLLLSHKDTKSFVSIKVTTRASEAQAKLMIDEVVRICEVNHSDPDTNFHLLKVIRGPIPSHAYTGKGNSGIYSFTVDVELTTFHTALQSS